MKNLSLFASALAVLGLTACEKALVDDIEDVGTGQVKNSVLQVRTRAGGSADEATVTYPVTVCVNVPVPSVSPYLLIFELACHFLDSITNSIGNDPKIAVSQIE